MKMTYTDALNAVLSMNIEDRAVVERLTTLRDTLEKRAQNRLTNDKARATSEKKKQENRAAREALMTAVLPVLRSVITTEDKTAEQIYNEAKVNLPVDWNVKKVQYVLLHELKDEIMKNDNGRNPNTYKRA